MMSLNKRLKPIAGVAVGMNLPEGVYELDGYNQKVITDGISFTVTTRISASFDHFVLEIHDEGRDTD